MNDISKQLEQFIIRKILSSKRFLENISQNNQLISLNERLSNKQIYEWIGSKHSIIPFSALISKECLLSTYQA